MQFNKDYWIGFSVYLPENWEVPNRFETLANIHQTADKGEPSIVNPFGIYTGSGKWKIMSRGHNVPLREWTLNSIWEDVGKWTDWVIHYKPSYGSQGILKVWKNGTLVATKSGPNTYKDAIGPYFKMGVYLGWKDRNCCDNYKEAKVVYHDALRIASGSSASYSDVAPRGSRN
jgi:hypothetical protein